MYTCIPWYAVSPCILVLVRGLNYLNYVSFALLRVKRIMLIRPMKVTLGNRFVV